MSNHISINLANSIWFANHEKVEVLEDCKWINDNLITIDNKLTENLDESTLNQLMDLRNIITQVFTSKQVSDHLDALNKYMSQASYSPRIVAEDYDIKMKWISSSNAKQNLLSSISINLVELITKDLLQQVKTCSNDECLFFFIDNSKNNSKKFCSKRCNNLIKSRRYRANQKKEVK